MKDKVVLKFGGAGMSAMNEESDLIPVFAEVDEEVIRKMKVPKTLPILPLRNTVLFPGVLLPITVGRDKSLKLLKDAYAGNKIIGAVSQKDGNIENPTSADLHTVGTMAHIIKIIEMPDESTTVIIQGQKRIKVEEFVTENPYFTAKTTSLADVKADSKDEEFDAIVSSLKDLSLRIIKLSTHIPNEAAFAVKNIENSLFLINFICSNSDIKPTEKQKLLEIDEIKQRAIILLEILSKEIQMLELKNDIQQKVKVDLDKQQKEYFLHQQMKTIQEELGGNPVEREIEDLKKKAKSKKWNEETAKFFNRELDKLHKLNPVAGEYSIQLNYVQTLLDLPWNEYTKDRLDLKKAEKILDQDHFGLEKVKERILEHLAVLKLKGDLKSPILCLYGPPGVGKTSLGKSIAAAIGRKYVRMSLGGLHDEAEIRGHRKTYIGAMCGRIMQNIRKVKSANPVFVLDEIDKVGNDFRGDPSSALLEVLDPEQNNAFYDNYLEIEFDLSQVMFIATANTTSTISPALRDRMELINVTGYIVEEKIEICKRHIVPKLLDSHGVKPAQFKVSDKILEYIIENYTRESGVRELEKKVAKIIRGVAKKIAFNKKVNPSLNIDLVTEYLGPIEYHKETYHNEGYTGVVPGLAWTAAGGEILFVETSTSKGKGALTVTGNLGEVMKESAVLALEYIKSHQEELGVQSKILESKNIHIHVPEGAIPKDGPSAGVTMVTSLVSALASRKVKPFIAMTGEITLRGKVLPVGGIKEKILAAKRAGLKEIILSKENRKDVEDIGEIYRSKLKFHYVENILEVVNLALLK